MEFKKGLLIFGISALVIMIIIIIIVALVFRKEKGTPATQFPSENLTLTWWGLYDDKEAFDQLISDYHQEHSNVTINYLKKEPDEYETELINALASGSGPDIFVIKNDWLESHKDKLTPAPENIFTKEDFEKIFVPVVSQDLVRDNSIYGMTFYVDTLALFYNNSIIENYNDSLNERDLSVQQLNSLTIEEIGQTWDEFLKQAKNLTLKSGAKITRSGAAIGTSDNVDWAADILSILMLQNNTQMVSNDKKTPTFNLPANKETGELWYPGTSALDFYTNFSRSSKTNYSWNSSLPKSSKAFIEGKTAMMINYSQVINSIKNLAPNLNFETALLPQVKGTEKRKDYAYYWANVISKDTKYPQVAWDFLKFASQSDYFLIYKDITSRPSSNLQLSEQSVDDQYYGVFNQQSKTALSWFKNKTPQKVDNIFLEMIKAVIDQNQPSQKAIDRAAESIKILWSS